MFLTNTIGIILVITYLQYSVYIGDKFDFSQAMGQHIWYGIHGNMEALEVSEIRRNKRCL